MVAQVAVALRSGASAAVKVGPVLHAARQGLHATPIVSTTLSASLAKKPASVRKRNVGLIPLGLKELNYIYF